MTMPDRLDLNAHRIQRKRTKGWRMLPNAVYVGRPTKWGNPFRIGRSALSRNSALTLFEYLFGIEPEEPLTNRQKFFYPAGKDYPVHEVHQLRGKHLVCWCPLYAPCHADVLLEIANE